MSLSEHDVVRLIKNIPAERIDRSLSMGKEPQIGDIGAIVNTYSVTDNEEACFIAECADSDGAILWVADFFASELQQISEQSGGT
jgi:hypothetical protein